MFASLFSMTGPKSRGASPLRACLQLEVLEARAVPSTLWMDHVPSAGAAEHAISAPGDTFDILAGSRRTGEEMPA